MSDEHRCHYCNEPGDLRPYGPGGSWVCSACVTATPERDAEAGARYLALVEAAAAISPSGAVVIDSDEGPQPVEWPEHWASPEETKSALMEQEFTEEEADIIVEGFWAMLRGEGTVLYLPPKEPE